MSETPVGSEIQTHQHRVLIVDDDPVILNLAEVFFTRNGFSVVIADDGEKALALFQNPETPPIDLILTDNNMPIMSGIELIRKVRKTHPHLPIILASANYFGGLSEEEKQTKARNVGATAGLSKPCNYKDVITSAKQLLEKAKDNPS